MTDIAVVSFRSLAAPAASFLVSSIWQSALLVAAVAVVLRLVPGLTAAVRSAIWSVVLLAVTALPVLLSVVSVWSHTAVLSEANPAVVHASRAWSTVVVGLWLGLSAYRVAELVLSAMRLRTLLRSAVPLEPGRAIAGLLQQGKRRVQLCESASVLRPCLVGFWRARIVLPTGLAEELATDDLQRVVIHEMEHLRRGDVWINLVQKVVLAFFPMHPVLAWLDRRVSLERELACDDGVLRRTHAPKAYAACLARLTESRAFAHTCALALGALGARERQPELVRRVRRILAAPEMPMTAGKARITVAALVTGVMVIAGCLARSPQLVSFSSGVATVAQGEAGMAKQVTASMPQQAARPATVVKASFRPEDLRPIRTAHRVRRSVVSVGTLRRQTEAPAPWLVMTSWQQTRALQPRLVPVQWTLERISEDPSPSYAAFATSDGWVIVQL